MGKWKPEVDLKASQTFKKICKKFKTRIISTFLVNSKQKALISKKKN